MSDQTPVVRPVREFRMVEDVVPILDTARFEHIQRISSAMAQSSLIPETLRGIKKGDNFQTFDHGTVVANVFRVVNQAVGWRMDPFSVMDHVSVVHGRLMYEGKLIHAVIEARVGIRLNYRFGRMVDGRFDPTEEGKGEQLAVQVFGLFSDEGEERTVEGWVADWMTTGKNSPWGKASNWKRQLRYRGAREWARAHSPGVVLGVITDDEMDDDLNRQERVTTARRGPRAKSDIVAKLEGARAAEGFDHDHVGRETATDDEGVLHDTKTGEVIEGEATAVEGKDAGTAGVQTAGADPATSDSASDASESSPESTVSGPEAGPVDDEDGIEELRRIAYEDGYQGEPVQAVLAECETDEEKAIAAEEHERGRQDKIEKDAEGHAKSESAEPVFDFTDEGGPAPKGAKYLLASDEPVDGRVQVYQDGKPFSKMGPKGANQLKRYDAHPEPADPALKTQSGGTGVPVEDKPKGGLWEEIAAMESWLAVKPRLSAIYQTDDFKALSNEDQAATRANLFGAVMAMKDRTRDPVDWAQDPSAFTLWADHIASGSDPDAADMIEGTFQTLQASAAYGRMKDAQKDTLSGRVAAMVHRLRGAG